MRECVDLYCPLIGISKDRLSRNGATPFIDEAKEAPCWVDEEAGGPIDWLAIKKRKMAAQASAIVEGFPKRLRNLRTAHGSVNRRGPSVEPVEGERGGHPGNTPTSGESGDIPHGAMNTEAASVIMKIMYGPRNCRFDLLCAVGAFARRLTKLGALEDRKLRRLTEYTHSPHTLQLTGFVGDRQEDLELVQYSDAGYAGDRSDTHSISGSYLVLVGPHSWFPLAASSTNPTPPPRLKS